MEGKKISISLLDNNKGQIEGLPKNPRFTKDARFKALKKSISDFPEMLEYREAIVYPVGKRFVVIGGNMRLMACKELGHKEMWCKVLPPDTTPERLKELVIKDNASFGFDDHEALANEWDMSELKDWGMSFNFMEDEPLETNYKPVLEPDKSIKEIEESDFDKAQKNLDEKFEKDTAMIEVICPHCAEIFFITKESAK